MDSLAQTAFSAPDARAQRNGFVGWFTIASGVALIIVGEKPYFPASLSLLILSANLVLFLGMIPVAMWLANSTASRAESSAGAARTAEWVGIAGVLVTVVTAILALPQWLPAIPAQILDTSSLGVLGLWLLVVTALALHTRLINRVLAVFGAIAGLGWFLAAVVMWVELTFGNLGSLVSTLESVRTLGGYVGEALYIIWALWLGIWLLARKR
jgi:hypothetical protein